MNKMVLIILLIMLSVFLVASTDNTDDNKTSNSQIVGGEAENDQNGRPEYMSLDFESVDEIIEALKTEENIASGSNGYGEPAVCSCLIEMAERGEIPVPEYGGRFDFLTENGERSEIVVFSEEVFNRSWIWYRGDFKGEFIVIAIMYLEEDEIGYLENHTCAEVIEYISPEFPNVHNYEEHSTAFSSIYQEEIQLAHDNVQALIFEDKEGERDYVHFVYDDLLVRIFAPPEVFTNEFFAQLDIGYIEIE